MGWRRPITFAYGNCIVGAHGAWALFALESHGHAAVGAERRRERFARVLAAIETVEADLQLLRVARRWDAAGELDALARGYAGPHPEAHARHLADAHRSLEAQERAELPATYLAVSLERPQRDVNAFVASLAEHGARGAVDELRELVRGRAARALAAAELERLRVRADEMHARVAAYLDARPARTVEVQWLVRRAFTRGRGEPVVDGLDEPQALVFERNGQAMLAPLEAEVLRWTDSVIESHGRSLRVESEIGTSWQAQLVCGALPERAPLGSGRLELMFGPEDSLPFPIDVTLCGRFLPNDVAVRLVRRRVQDADEIARAEAAGDQGVSDRGFDRTQDARDLLAYLGSASHPPLLRATISVAVAAGSQEELERRIEAVRRAFGEVRLHRPLGDQLRVFIAGLPGQRATFTGYDDVLTPEQVAALAPLASHPIGSRRGFLLGHTLTGGRHPVRLNLREGSDADRNAAILSVGALGSGKTTLDQKLAYEAFLLGARVIDCDPKGDHRLHELDEVAPHVETIALRGERALRGMLDPLRIAP
jgi:hypothetical protein